MSRRTRLLAFATGWLFALGVSAAPAPAPTIDTIVSDYVAARGGLAKIHAIQSLRQSGHAFGGGGREAIVTREMKRPGKVRFEFTVQGMTAAFVANGKEGWMVSPFEGDMAVKPMAEDAIEDAMEQADIEGPLVDWKAKGHQVELAGHEMVAGRDAYKLKLTLKGGAVRTLYIDTKSHQHVRTDVTREIRGRKVAIETTFSQHKRSGGVLFPGVVEVAAAGRPQKLRLVVDSIVVNPAIADSRFERTAPSK